MQQTDKQDTHVKGNISRVLTLTRVFSLGPEAVFDPDWTQSVELFLPVPNEFVLSRIPCGQRVVEPAGPVVHLPRGVRTVKVVRHSVQSRRDHGQAAGDTCHLSG